MKRVVDGLEMELLVAEMAPAQGADRRTECPRFPFGGAPELESPPLPRNARGKQALVVRDGKCWSEWYLGDTAREGRVTRPWAEAAVG